MPNEKTVLQKELDEKLQELQQSLLETTVLDNKPDRFVQEYQNGSRVIPRFAPNGRVDHMLVMKDLVLNPTPEGTQPPAGFNTIGTPFFASEPTVTVVNYDARVFQQPQPVHNVIGAENAPNIIFAGDFGEKDGRHVHQRIYGGRKDNIVVAGGNVYNSAISPEHHDHHSAYFREGNDLYIGGVRFDEAEMGAGADTNYAPSGILIYNGGPGGDNLKILPGATVYDRLFSFMPYEDQGGDDTITLDSGGTYYGKVDLYGDRTGRNENILRIPAAIMGADPKMSSADITANSTRPGDPDTKKRIVFDELVPKGMENGSLRISRLARVNGTSPENPGAAVADIYWSATGDQPNNASNHQSLSFIHDESVDWLTIASEGVTLSADQLVRLAEANGGSFVIDKHNVGMFRPPTVPAPAAPAPGKETPSK